MKRAIISVVAATLCVLLLASGCYSAGFEKKLSYTDSFADVGASEWYAAEVKSAYELGFMKGMSDTLFSPNGNVTVAEAITMAARVHASYNNKAEPVASTSGSWYQSFVDYAVAEGIIEKDMFDGYDRNIKRSEMAQVFYNSVPSNWLTKINNVDYLPDINEKADYRDEILALYNSGVVMGNDQYGTFYPDNDIKRCEAAAIINRIALPDNRLKKTLSKRQAPVAPLYYIDDSGNMDMSVYGQYGWEFDQRGVPAGTAAGRITVLDTSTTERTAMLRTFAEQSSGTIVMETNMSFQSGDNGFLIVLSKDEESEAMRFITKDGRFFAKEGDKLTDTGFELVKNVTVKTITDMDAKTNTLIIDGKLIGTYGYADDTCTSVNTLTFAGTKEDAVVVDISKTKLYTGYALNEIFLSSKERDELPYNWTLEGGATAKVASLASNSYDSFSAKLALPENTTNTLSTSFDPITRKVIFEMKFYMPAGYSSGMRFALTSAGNEVVSIYTDGDKYYSNDGQLLRTYNNKVWQTIRIEANTDTGVVDYNVNNKILASGKFTANSFDGIKVTLPAAQATELYLDDFYVYNSFDEEPDYVPEPVPVDSDEGIVGIEVCDIWRNGFQHGWDYASAYDEIHPYLGMFDEGSTEVADWETKWLVEHGVDFKLTCWYSGTPSQAVKTPRNSFGLNAQLNSKYTDMMKYAIMWENAGNVPKTAQEFRDNIVEYWKEYYLYDKDRYFTIDNKALITIYISSNMATMCGSIENVKKELDYLRQVCVDLGYDGAIILTCGGSANASIKEMGFDGIYAYNWGQSAFDPEFQKTQLNAQYQSALNNGVTSVPTVGVGFCNMYLGQGNKRSDLIKPDDLENLLKWVKTDFLGERTDTEDWKSKMVILSNWNEFGEGHYILPTNRIGFTYLDAIRNAFSSAEKEHEDLRPDDDTRARYNALYDQNRKRIRRYELINEDENIDLSTLTSTLKYDFTDPSTPKILQNLHGNSSTEYTSKSFKGVSAGGDFAVVTNKDIGIKAENAEYFRIIYKATALTEKEHGQIFFTTNNDGAWNEHKHTDFDIIADGEYHEYVVKMSALNTWKDEIARVRIDPINRGDCKWEIQLIEFLDAPEAPEIYINGTSAPIATVFTPDYSNGVLAAVIDPYAQHFFAKLGVFYRWDYDNQLFTLYGQNGSYIIYEMGNSIAKSSKGDIMLGISPELVDGIPLIEIDAMAKALDLNLTIDGTKYYLVNSSLVDEKGNVGLDILWDFNVSGYLDGFSTSCADVLKHEDGVVEFISTTNGRRHDPVLSSPSQEIDSVKYEKIVVGFSYDVTGGISEGTTGITSTIFYAAPGGAMNGNDIVQVQTEGLSSNGEIIEVEFDMTQSENWSGKIGQLRFDPFEAEGTFAVDYIKVVLTNPEGIRRVKPKATEVILDAEDPNNLPAGVTYKGVDATVKVTDDPKDKNNKVFLVETTLLGRRWAYFNIYMHFEPGKTYTVTYRVYGLKDAAGGSYKSNNISGNFIYGTDGENVMNHVTSGALVSSESGWYDCVDVYTVDGSYSPTSKDCFQFWSNPINGAGVSFLVDDIKIEITG